MTHDVDMDIVIQLLAILRSDTFLNTPFCRMNAEATVSPPINPRRAQSVNDAISLWIIGVYTTTPPSSVIRGNVCIRNSAINNNLKMAIHRAILTVMYFRKKLKLAEKRPPQSANK